MGEILGAVTGIVLVCVFSGVIFKPSLVPSRDAFSEGVVSTKPVVLEEASATG